MKILLLGSGGREHALAWKFDQSIGDGHLYIAPGNPGTALCGTNVSLDITDFEAVGHFCTRENIELVIVGPEEPLVNGICDFFKSKDELCQISFIGPSRNGAQLEGSKAFAKEFMIRHGIPTAAYREFTMDNYEKGIQYIQQHTLPIVIKADGLAAGKGVAICQHQVEALAEFELMIQNEKFGKASKKVVVEEFLHGIELSVIVLTDGKNYKLLPEAKDYKRIGEGDKGLNTGGMGAVSPVPFANTAFMKKVEERIIEPTIKGLQDENIEYTGFIFFGLINVKDDPFVIEYNCRLGDPETEVIIPRIKSDLVALLQAAAHKRLDKITLDLDERAAVTVMAVSRGYPTGYEKGYEIKGIDKNYGNESMIFQAGTSVENGKVVTNGGRVITVTSYGSDLEDAVSKSLNILDHIEFDGIYYRTDIGYEFLPV